MQAANIPTELPLLRLLQLSSAALPVGGFSFSQGLEYAVEAQWLKDAGDVQEWLTTVMRNSLTHVDLPLLARLHTAWQQQDDKIVCYWNDFALACRETAELQAMDMAMGNALRRLLNTLGVSAAKLAAANCSVVTLFALAAARWNISVHSTSCAYVWSWLENQVAAATKLVPLGQSTAQCLLFTLAEQVPATVAISATVADDDIGSSLPSLALASAWHETQYCRLFQS